MFRFLVILGCLLAATVLGAAEPLDGRLRAAAGDVVGATAGTDATAMRAAAATFSTTWTTVEDGIRGRDRHAYAAIEEAMGDLQYHLAADSFDLAEARAAAARLATLTGASAAPAPAPVPLQTATATAPAETAAVTLATVHARTLAASAALRAGRAEDARIAMADVRRWWPDVEGGVKTRDAAAYRDVEDLLASATAQLKAGDAAADAAIGQLAARLQPFIDGGSYGALDAFLILLREGIEALFVIAALLAFLGRSGHADRKRVIWWGAGAGVAVSLGLALVIHVAFKAAFSGADRELVEGVVGLVAAGMLFWVSWWLHRAANLSRWNAYIAERTSAALASGSVITLGALAFLAVLREGAETALFFLGMAPSIATGDLLLGLALGAIALAAVGVAIIALGARLPMRPLFAVLGVLILVMGVKFVGAGIHALQIAQIMHASVIAWLPTVEALGFFPTWETVVAQSAALALVLLLLRLGSRPATPRPQPA